MHEITLLELKNLRAAPSDESRFAEFCINLDTVALDLHHTDGVTVAVVSTWDGEGVDATFCSATRYDDAQEGINCFNTAFACAMRHIDCFGG